MSSGAPVAFRLLLDDEQHAEARATASMRDLRLQLAAPSRPKPKRLSTFLRAAAWIAERVADGLDDIVDPDVCRGCGADLDTAGPVPQCRNPEHIPIIAPMRFGLVPEPPVLVHPAQHVCQVPDCADDCA